MDIRNGFIKNLPLPLFGLALGIIALANLLKQYSIIFPIIGGFVSIVLLARVVYKLISYPDFLHENIVNPISIGVLGTFPMTLMIFSTFIQPLNNSIAFGLWIISIIIQLSLIFYFTIKILPKISLGDVYPTYLITYVGVSLISITSASFNLKNIGFIFCILALIFLFTLLVIITYRYIKIPLLNKYKPLTALYAAPSIVVVSYMSVFNVNPYFLIFLYCFTGILYLIALFKIIEYSKKLPWCPNHASYTFPFVINATSSQLVYFYFNFDLLYYYFIIQTFIATFLVIFEAYMFVRHVYVHNDLIDC